MRLYIVTCLCLLILLAASPLRAETREQFAGRVEAAYAADDKLPALKNLFFLDGVDAETMKTYDNHIIGRAMGKFDDPEITFEPLAKDFYPVQVIGAYEYRPNVKPLGYLVLGGRTKVLYGQRDGHFGFTAVTRSEISPPPPPDVMLQMMVIGLGSPPVRYSGYCDVMLGNGDVQRIKLDDSGQGGNTSIITAQYIVGCELINTSGRDALSLHLLAGEKTLFQQRIASPDAEISYRRDVPK